MSLRVPLLVLGLALLGAPIACGGDEAVNADGGVTIPDAGTPDATDDTTTPPDGGDAATGPVVRTVETRARFGALDPDNLLLDGDFEYSGQDAMQYPWFQLDYTWIVTGTRCRHGLRCAEIPNGQLIFGTFVWPDTGSVDIEYYAKPSGTGDCTQEVGGALIPLADYAGAPPGNMRVSATDPTPDADGWCHVTANMPVPADTGNSFWAMLLAPRQNATGSILVDDVSIRAHAGASNAVAASVDPSLAALVARARADFAKRPPLPPRSEPAPVLNRTGRRPHLLLP